MARQIKLTRGKLTTVDDDDFEKISKFKWCYSESKSTPYGGYATRGIYDPKTRKIKQEFMHRVIVGAKKRQCVDHINHDKLDNRKENLRIATKNQNMYNRIVEPRGSSIYKGVTWEKARKKWQAHIGFNNRRITIGRYENEIDAAIAYNKKASELFGEFALLYEDAEISVIVFD